MTSKPDKLSNIAVNYFPEKLVCLKPSYVRKGNLIANIKLKAIMKLSQSVNLLFTGKLGRAK